VGYGVAESPVSRRNDITAINTDAVRLRDLEPRFGLRGVVGSGIEPGDEVLAARRHIADGIAALPSPAFWRR
jgi:Trk K+ transport system NAD-binding subunit